MSPETPGVAVIGCGYWGKNHVRNYAALGALRLVSDPSSTARTLARQLASDVRVVDSLTDVWNSEVAGVVVATPAETHVPIVRDALLAGKDVLCEKPLALDHREGVELAELAAARGRILMVGHVLEYHPAIARLAALMQSGDLGDIYYLYSNRLSLGKVRREENILWSFAPHDIAIMLRLLGRMPIQIAAWGGTYLQRNVADTTVTHLTFDGGVGAHIYVSWLHPFKEHRLVVIGSRKMASFDDVGKRLVLYDKRVDVLGGEPVPTDGGGIEVDFDRSEPLARQSAAFLQAIATRQTPLSDAWSAVRVLQVLEAAQRSLAAGGRTAAIRLEEAV